MKLSLPAVVAAVVLVVVSGAQAKIPANGVDVCGRSGRVHLAFQQSQLIWTGGHEIGRPLRVPSPFYLLRYKWFASDPGQTAYYVPAARAVRFASERATDATWMWLDRDAASVVDRAAAGLTPYAVRPLTTVTVGDKQARGPETYLRLLRGRGAGLITPARCGSPSHCDQILPLRGPMVVRTSGSPRPDGAGSSWWTVGRTRSRCGWRTARGVGCRFPLRLVPPGGILAA